MKVFKQVNLNGSYKNNSDKYQLLIHYNPSTTTIYLYDEVGNEIYYSNYAETIQVKILIPPHYSISNINAGLFIELDNLEELKGLL